MTTRRPMSPAAIPIAGTVSYLMALALLGPAISPFVSIWGEGANVGSVLWRFGVYGQIIVAQFYIFVALPLGALAAGLLGHRKVLLAVGIFATLLTLVLAAGGPLFVLDFLQLKRSMNPTAFAPFRIAGFKVVAMAFLGVPVLALVAFQTLRAARALGADERSQRAPPSAPTLGRK